MNTAITNFEAGAVQGVLEMGDQSVVSTIRRSVGIQTDSEIYRGLVEKSGIADTSSGSYDVGRFVGPFLIPTGGPEAGAAKLGERGLILAGEKTATKLTGKAGNGADDTIRVGRWMGEDEFVKMSNSGRVIEGGGRTYVTSPANPDAYPAGKGIFAGFNVPRDSVFPASKPEWGVIPGPNITTRRYGPPPTEMPPATCIVLVCR